ncbi:MAG: CDP-glycerol glycerophosphotransferase family protein [Clostridia bacterium]|nr:CDP-glycerol glycerophosphotransferase family protein [Clostridia bacterium]
MYKVSVIIPIWNVEDYLAEAIDSVINQTCGFEESIELILVNDGSPDSCDKICRKYAESYPDNIIYIEQENKGLSAARNAALEVASCEYIAFLDSDDKFSENYIEAGLNFFDKYGDEVDFVAFPLYLFENVKSHDHILNKKFTETRIIDITEEYKSIQAHIASTLIRREAIINRRFNTKLTYAEDGEMLHRILMDKRRYGVSVESKLLYRKRWRGNSAIQTCNERVGWYDKLLVLPRLLIEQDLNSIGTVSKYTQFQVMYDTQWYKSDRIPESVRSKIDVKALYDNIEWILQYIDEDIIKSASHMNFWQKYYLRKIKHKADAVLKPGPDGVPAFYFHDKLFQTVCPGIWVSLIEEEAGSINIGGYYTLASYDGLELVAKYRKKVYSAQTFHQKHRDIYFLGKPVLESKSFMLNIPYSGKGEIEFFVYSEKYGFFPAKLEACYCSRLRNKEKAFILGDNTIIAKTEARNILKVSPFSLKLLKENITAYTQANFNDEAYKEEISLLNDYIRLYPEMSQKNIWIFMDRHDRADDNAEHLFRYCSSINDKAERYFIIDKNSPEKTRLKQYGNVVDYGSREHKLLVLFADKYVTSNFDFIRRYPFGDADKIDIFQGLVKSRFIFLQHGITKDDMSRLLDRLTKNFKLFITAAPAEYESVINNENYGYTKAQVKLTGFARYDNLYNARKKQIVFMPTWRNALQSTTDIVYKYSESFKYSKYFNAISEFLNDKALIAAAKQYGYEIIFRPHPVVYNQLSDFKLNPYIKVSPYETSYQKIYAEASLIITDYSSAIFDYAYLKKPLIYYHFDDNQYEKGYFDYDTMGFGEVVKSRAELTALVLNYIRGDCSMPDKYKHRVDSFFCFCDTLNCKRIYDEIVRLK